MGKDNIIGKENSKYPGHPHNIYKLEYFISNHHGNILALKNPDIPAVQI